MTIAVVGIVINLLAFNIESELLMIASRTAVFGFLLVAIAYTFSEVTFSTEISFNRLLGAICVYLLLGLIWSLLYSFIEALSPGSFHGIEAGDDHGVTSEWGYFSFVTMTTLGYGDFLPSSESARAGLHAGGCWPILHRDPGRRTCQRLYLQPASRQEMSGHGQQFRR